MTIGTIGIIVGVVLLILIKIFFKNGDKPDPSEGINKVGDVIQEEDPWNDPGWSTLTGNIYNKDEK